MNRKTHNAFTLLAATLCALFLTACGSGSQDTPKNAVKKMANALRGGNKDAYAECFLAPKEQPQLPDVEFDLRRAYMRLEKEVTENPKLKKEGWEEIRNVYYVPNPELPTNEDIDKATQTITRGSAATVGFQGDNAFKLSERQLIKKNGLWYMDWRENAKTPARLELDRGMARALNEVADEANKSGADDIQKLKASLEAKREKATAASEKVDSGKS